MATATLKAVVEAQDNASDTLKKVAGTIKDTTDEVNKSADAAKNSGLSFGQMATAVAVGEAAWAGIKWAVNETVGVFKDFIDKAAESEKVMAQTAAVVKSTKEAAGMSAEAISDLATALANITPYDDEVIQSTENLILTFTQIGKDIFPDVTKTALDMSAALGQDTKSSAIQLGKALQDPITGVTALRRVGVTFNDQQMETIQKLVEQNKLFDAQKLILKELQVEFGGSAEAAGKTYAGQMTILNTKIDNFKEKIGTALLTGLTPFINKINEWVESDQGELYIEQLTIKVTELTHQFTEWINNAAIPWIKEHWPAIKAVLLTVGDVIVKITGFIFDHTKALEALFVILGAAKLLGAIQGVTTAIAAAGGLGPALLSATPLALAFCAAFTAEKIWQVYDAAKSLNKELENLDSESKKEWWSNLNWWEKTVVTFTGHGNGFASGTDYVPETGEYLVGERGPEKVILPKGSQVIPNNKLGQGNISVHIYGNVYNDGGQKTEDLLKKIARQFRMAEQGAY